MKHRNLSIELLFGGGGSLPLSGYFGVASIRRYPLGNSSSKFSLLTQQKIKTQASFVHTLNGALVTVAPKTLGGFVNPGSMGVIDITAEPNGLSMIDTKRGKFGNITREFDITLRACRIVIDFERVVGGNFTIPGRFDSHFVIDIAYQRIIVVNTGFLIFECVAYIAIRTAEFKSAFACSHRVGRTEYFIILINRTYIVITIPQHDLSFHTNLNVGVVVNTSGTIRLWITLIIRRRIGLFWTIYNSILSILTCFRTCKTRDFIFETHNGVLTISSTFAKSIGICTFFIKGKSIHTSAAFAHLPSGTRGFLKNTVCTYTNAV